MDFLVQQNLAKKNLISVDIGLNEIKVLAVNVVKGKIKISAAFKIKNAFRYFSGNDLNMISELVKEVHDKLRENGVKSKEVRIILPDACTQHRVIEAKAVKDKDLPSFIANESGSMMSKAASTINCTDWCVLSSNDSGEESTKLCMVYSIHRKVAYGLASEFEKLKYTVTVMTTTIMSMRGIYDLYKADYENPVQLFVDFGATSIRMYVVNSGELVFLREFHSGGQIAAAEIYDELTKNNSESVVDVNLDRKGLYDILTNVGVKIIGLQDNSGYSEYGSQSDSMFGNDYGYSNGVSDSEFGMGSEGSFDNDQNNSIAGAGDYDDETNKCLQLLYDHGIDPTVYNDEVERHYDQFISEVIKTIDFCNSGLNKPTKILYMGNIKNVGGFVERLKASIDLEIEEINLNRHNSGSGYVVDNNTGIELDSSYANALGAGIDLLI